MNIVFVVTKIGRGGAQRVSVILANYLKEQGHDVSILYYDEDGTYSLRDGIVTQRLPYSKNPLVKHIRRIGAFVRYCRKNHTDLMIALFRGYDYTYIYRKLFKAKLLLSQRNDPKAEYDNDFMARMEAKLFFRSADRVVFQTAEEAEYFDDKIRKKSAIIPNPVLEDLPEPYGGERRKEIVNFCRLVPQKNLKLLIDAFEEVRRARDGYTLTIYGNGAERDQLRQYIAEKGLEKAAFIRPFDADIHNKVKDAAMFVSSSDFEGISNSMLEAMAMGMPVICTDCPAGGARQTITDGVNGLLTPVGDRAALSQAMIKLIDAPDFAEKLGKEAAKVREAYSPRRICAEWEKVIHDLQ